MGIVSFKDIQVIFGTYDTDVIISYTTCFKLEVDVVGPDAVGYHQARYEEIIYDEVKMVTSAKVHAKDDLVFITLLKHKLFIDSQSQQRTQPIRNGMKLTPNEYREFISSFGFFQNYLKKWFNNVYFKDGLNFPYNP